VTTGSTAAEPVITALYVPGDRPDRFDKAVASGADLVILDLEDAVTAAHKAAARDAVIHWLSAHPAGSRPAVEVRVNAGDHDDLTALAVAAGVAIRLPKVESAADLDRVVDALGAVAIAAIVETAVGVEALGEITRHPAVGTVSLGEADLASDLGTRSARVLDAVRARLLVAARAAGLPPPMASVFTDIGDLDGLRADTEQARDMGFVGRAAIHPVQLPVIAAAFAPSPREVAWADEVLAVTAVGGVARLTSGEMVDPAMRGRAEAIRRLAARGR
jgi:citrate lyase subunit beta / citryl-CoA lyase